jgi:hypothetical protein
MQREETQEEERAGPVIPSTMSCHLISAAGSAVAHTLCQRLEAHLLYVRHSVTCFSEGHCPAKWAVAVPIPYETATKRKLAQALMKTCSYINR